ncbi:MAG: hypothetical protein ABI640_02360 [Gammaproteobacteria bacterium]
MPAEPLRLSQLGGVPLYCGPDLASAARRSAESAAAGRAATPAATRRFGARALGDALNASSLRLLPASVLVTGTERVSGTTMRVLFRGRSRSIDFCASHILGSADFERSPAASAHGQLCDVVVVDHPFLGIDPFRRYPALHVPQWVRQQCELGATWDQTLEQVPRALRKLVASQLRAPGIAASLDFEPSALVDFYRSLYVPFLRERFALAAVVPSERAFLRQASGAGLLTLRIAGDLVGAQVVKRARDTLFIGKSALSLHHSQRNRSELLDYFSFLVAQITGSRWLDFGASRPHLEDGVLLYKAKWRPRLAPNGLLKNRIHIRLVSRSAAIYGFLQRNGFIERFGRDYVVRRLVEHAPGADEAAQVAELATRVGLAALVVRQLDAAVDPVRSWLDHA